MRIGGVAGRVGRYVTCGVDAIVATRILPGGGAQGAFRRHYENFRPKSWCATSASEELAPADRTKLLASDASLLGDLGYFQPHSIPQLNPSEKPSVPNENGHREHIQCNARLVSWQETGSDE